jgi:folate-binding protein YgfZ
MTKIPYLTTARVSGDDAQAFLQAQLTADIAALSEHEQTFACYCTPRGQVLGLLLVERAPEGYLLAGARELLPDIVRRLQIYVLRSKVNIQLAEDTGVSRAADGSYGFGNGTGPAGNPDHLKAAELRRGISWLSKATSEKYIPQMLGFDRIGAVSFSKGCYPGQEIVARAKYLGKVKRGPLVVYIENQPGLEIGNRVRLSRAGEWDDATVVDFAAGENGGTVAFLVARSEPAADVEALDHNGEHYRCATI